VEKIKRMPKNKIEGTCNQVHQVRIQTRICPQFMEIRHLYKNHRVKYNGMNGHILKILSKLKNKAG
jgi:hypothetical protein